MNKNRRIPHPTRIPIVFERGGRLGFSELLVNQCIEYAIRAYNGGYAQDEVEKRAWQRGYEAARREFAEATGLYTSDDV
jgi:hypothetical protein